MLTFDISRITECPAFENRWPLPVNALKRTQEFNHHQERAKTAPKRDWNSEKSKNLEFMYYFWCADVSVRSKKKTNTIRYIGYCNPCSWSYNVYIWYHYIIYPSPFSNIHVNIYSFIHIFTHTVHTFHRIFMYANDAASHCMCWTEFFFLRPVPSSTAESWSVGAFMG